MTPHEVARAGGPPPAVLDPALRELVVCSLEPWDEIWRRNQFFVDALLRRNPELRVLFVEPAADVLFDIWERRVPTLPRLRTLSKDGRLRAFRPLKLLPRRAGPMADWLMLRQVKVAIRMVGIFDPTLWINDVTYAPLIEPTGWSSVYDVTDDWLLAPFPPRELERLAALDQLALDAANEVVVCSPALVASRSVRRHVSLIPNGVDIDHFQRPRARPADLPDGPVAIYVGSLHDARIDVELIVEVARALPQVNVVLVGPNSLSSDTGRKLSAEPNVSLLGPRPYLDIPAFLQHADVIIVPHRVTEFTESLDPIKAYECLAVDRPTVSTPVAGFRDHDEAINVVGRDEFVRRVADVLAGKGQTLVRVPPAEWHERAASFENVLLRARGRPNR